MTLAGRVIALFPSVHILTICTSIIAFAMNASIASFLLVPAAIYLFPLLCFRVHNLIAPLKPGRSNIGLPVYCPWWGSFQFQALFCALPWLEGLLRLIPGCFSAWLRLWGSRIGKNVFWAPVIEITDRIFMDVGHGAILGHESKCIGHFISRNQAGELELYVQGVTIGEGAFVGAGSRLGPGAKIGRYAKLKILTDVYYDVEIPEGYLGKPRQLIKGEAPASAEM